MSFNFKEGIEAIKRIVFSVQQPDTPVANPAPAPTPAHKFEDVKTVDGKVISLDKLEVGANALIDGVAAPDGEYQLENGGKLSVVGGLVTELELEPSVVPEEPMPAAAPAAMTIEQLAAEVAELKKQLGTNCAAQTQAFASQDQANKLIVEWMEKFADQPIEQPKRKPKTFDDLSPLERFRATKSEK